MLPRAKRAISSGHRRTAAPRLLGVLMALVLLSGVTQTCGEDEPSTPLGLGPTPKPAPLHLAEGDSLDWELDYGSALNLVDDDCAQLPIGFEFEFFGVTYTQLWVNTNGNVTFNECNRNYLAPDIPYGDPDNADVIIAVLWGDFIGGEVYVNTLGTENQRRFVITWSEVHEYEGSTGPNSFQIQLFEGSNTIQFGYNGLSTDGINWTFS